MQFFCVRTQAIQQTHQALLQLQGRRRGSSKPSRALRVASLYGHLQWRARPTGVVCFAIRELAEAWHLQPRLLRDDLADLQAMGWLSYSTGPQGTRAELHRQGSSTPAPQRSIELKAPSDLVEQFAAIYNRHRPGSWPAYQPKGAVLLPRLQRAIRYAGSPESLWERSAAALSEMPSFWRETYPNGRSGSDCIAALLSADRKAAGLGPEFWHVFTWGAGACGRDADLERARRLFLWDGHQWRGQGIEALKLQAAEKQRLIERLEAEGQGPTGSAALQFQQPAEMY